MIKFWMAGITYGRTTTTIDMNYFKLTAGENTHMWQSIWNTRNKKVKYLFIFFAWLVKFNMWSDMSFLSLVNSIIYIPKTRSLI